MIPAPRPFALLAAATLMMGCAAAPVSPAGSEPGEAEELGLSERAPFAFSNPAPPTGATHPLTGATNVYQRSADGSRHSPFDLQIRLFNGKDADVTGKHRARLLAAYRDIYQWNYASWSTALDSVPAARKTAILNGKKDAFWESLAQHLSERVFGSSTTENVYKFGPRCATATCDPSQGNLAEVERIEVRTTVHGERDPLNPVTRTIVFDARRHDLSHPSVTLRLLLPEQLRVASPSNEVLDFRPAVGGRRDALTRVEIVATVDPKARARVVGFDYPDFNRIFIPMRHLVFQGEVSNTRGPDASLSYATPQALTSRFVAVASGLMAPETAKSLAQELTPFLTQKYYYMFGDETAVAGYKSYILGADAGVAKGLHPELKSIELWVNGVRLAGHG